MGFLAIFCLLVWDKKFQQPKYTGKKGGKQTEIIKFESSPFSWPFRPISLLPGQESRRRRQKGPGVPFPVLPSSFPQRDAEIKGYPCWNGRSPHLEKGSYRLFWSRETREMLFCPGMEPFGHRGLPLFAEPHENKSFSKRSPGFFSPKSEMIQKNDALTYNQLGSGIKENNDYGWKAMMFAEKGPKVFMAAIFAYHTGKAFGQISAP